MDLKQEIHLPSLDFRKIKWSQLYKNKYIVLGVLITTTLIMFGYIFVIPSSMKKTNKTTLSYNRMIQPTLAQLPQQTITPVASISPTIYNPVPTVTLTHTPSPRPTLTSIPTPTPTPGWKTYQNVTYGYKVKYPPDWTMRDLGALEPKIPSYIVFNQNTASAAARYISISASTRTLQEQLAIDGQGFPESVASVNAFRQYFKDSNGQTSAAIVIPRTNYLIILRSKTPYLSIFNQMLTTFQLLN